MNSLGSPGSKLLGSCLINRVFYPYKLEQQFTGTHEFKLSNLHADQSQLWDGKYFEIVSV